MSAPSLESVTSTSSSGHADGLGRRELCFDRETGAMLERLHVRPELAAFGVAVREQVERLATFEDARFARTCSTDRDAESGDLTVVSEFVPGIRLTDLLETARDEALVPGVDAALGYLLEALDAIGAFHASAGCAHGLIAPDRTVFTPDGHLVFLDPAYAAVVERLGLSRRRLWIEFGIAAAPAASPARLDQAGDLSQAALSAVMLILGRALEDSDYPDNLPSLLMEVVEIAQIRGSAAFAGGLQKVFQRLLPLPGRRPYTTAEEALADLRQVVRREIGVEVCRAGLIEFVRQLNPSQVDAVPGLHEEALAQDEDVDDASLDESDDPAIDRPADELTGDAVIEFELDLDPLAEPGLTRGAAPDQDEVFELGSYDLNQDLGQFATTRPIITPRRDLKPIPAAPLTHDPAPSTEHAADTVQPIGAAPLHEPEPEIDPGILDVAAASPAASDSITPATASADPPFAAAAFAGHDVVAEMESQDAHSSPQAAAGAELPQHDEGATDWETTLFSAQPRAILAESGDAVAEPSIPGDARQSAQAAEPIGADATVDDRTSSIDITPSADAAATATAPAPAVDHAMEPAAAEAHEAPSAPIERVEPVAEPAVDHVSPAPAPEPMSAKGGRRKRQQQKSARARKDKLRSTATAKPEIVAPASTPPPASTPAPAASSSKSGWLIPPEKTAKFEGNAPELMASPFQSPAVQMSPPAPTPPPPQPVVSYQPPVTPLPAAPVFPALPAQGAPMPRFGTLGTPRVAPVQPAPAALQPPSAGPVAFEPVARLTPLKVKAEPPAGYTPAGHNRRGGRDVRLPLEPVAHLPYGPGPHGSEAAAGSRGFPLKLTIAAVVIVAAAILVGRSYLPGGVLGKSAADATTATLPAADPEPVPTDASPAGTGQIVVTTEPAGARILLDGKPAGESPQTLNAIAAGKHVVTLVSSSGSVKRTVKVVAGRAVTLDVPVFSGWVTVFAPFVVEIAEDGKSLGTTEHGKLMIAPGRHHLVITNADLAFSTEQDVEVTAGDVSSVRLNPKGQANFNAIPWAEVWSDGHKIGDTPIANYELPLGSHEFVFKHPQFGERKVTATIRATQPAAVATDFTKQP